MRVEDQQFRTEDCGLGVDVQEYVSRTEDNTGSLISNEVKDARRTTQGL